MNKVRVQSVTYLITCLTVPTAAPQNIVAETESATSLHIRWDPPPEDTRNGDLLGYKVAVQAPKQAICLLQNQL